MNEHILTHARETRKCRGLAIAAQPGAVIEIGPLCYQVESASDPTTTYTVHTDPGAQSCTCRDDWAHARGIPCKHIFAALAVEIAPDAAQVLMDRHGLNLDQLSSKLINDLAQPLDPATANRLTCVLHAVNAMIDQRDRLGSEIPIWMIEPDPVPLWAAATDYERAELMER